MSATNGPPKEGDLYKTIKIDRFTFELRFGYYADYERKTGEPVVVYPDLNEQKLYTQDGRRLVTAIQDPCDYYEAANPMVLGDCCCDCIHYRHPGDDIGICGKDAPPGEYEQGTGEESKPCIA